MKAFIEILREKYGLAQPGKPKAAGTDGTANLPERGTYRTGGRSVPSFYLVADGIWRGHYLRDGVDISLWFAFQATVSFPPGDMWPEFLLWFPSKP